MTGFLRRLRRRPGGYALLASLRPEPDPDPYDPSGNGPIDEAARRRAVTTLIAAMGRHLR